MYLDCIWEFLSSRRLLHGECRRPSGNRYLWFKQFVSCKTVEFVHRRLRPLQSRNPAWLARWPNREVNC